MNKVLAWFNIATNPTSSLLLLDYVFKSNNKQYDPNFHSKYQQIVGSLIYLMISSHPDIRFSVVRLSQKMANLLNKHYQARLYLCRYLFNTCKYWIVYNELSNESVIAQDSESCKSITGYFTLMTYGVTSWMSC